MSLVKLAGEVFYIAGRTNVGVVVRDDWCILVDSGLDDDYGRRVLRALRAEGLRPRYLVNTHSHADHIGGNGFLARRAGVEVVAPEVEADFVEHPILEPLYLYGAYPPREMRGKLVMAKPSKVSRVVGEGFDEELGVEFVALPGHSVNLHAVGVDGVLFVGDALFPRELMEKYGVIYHVDVGRAVESMRKLLDTDYRVYVPSHAPHTSDVGRVVEDNLRHIEEVREAVLEEVVKPVSFEELLDRVLQRFKVKVMNLPLHQLYSSTIKSYLAWLSDEGSIKYEVKGGRVFYARA